MCSSDLEEEFENEREKEERKILSEKIEKLQQLVEKGEGAARSINMATLVYTSWELQGEADKILLKGQSLGNGQTIDFTQTGVIAKTADGNYTLTIEGPGTVYTKAKQ